MMKWNANKILYIQKWWSFWTCLLWRWKEGEIERRTQMAMGCKWSAQVNWLMFSVKICYWNAWQTKTSKRNGTREREWEKKGKSENNLENEYYNSIETQNESENVMEYLLWIWERERAREWATKQKHNRKKSRENCFNETSCEQIDYINIMNG